MTQMDEMAHIMKQMAAQQAVPQVFAYGHITSYDPVLHRVKLLIPTFRDDAGNFVISPWMPLNSPWVGAGFGMQICPLGGSTQQNPTAGEQCTILLIGKRRGVSVTACMVYNELMLPPLPGILPGEAILQHMSGSFIRFHASGVIEINAQGDINAIATGNVNATAGENVTVSAPNGDITATAGGTANVTAGTSVSVTAPEINFGDGGSLQNLLNSAAAAIYNEHTHDVPDGVSQIPNQQITSSQQTTVVKAQ